MAASTRSKKKLPPSLSHSPSSPATDATIPAASASNPSFSSPSASASSTAVSAPGTASRRPLTDPAYRHRYVAGASLPKKPGRRESVFVEDLDAAITSPATVAAGINSLTTPPPSRSPGAIQQYIHSVNPLGTKESYIMQLPILPSRFSILLFLLVACSTISLSTSAEHDLDGLLKRVPGAEGVVERREGIS
ncbi:hypothetical protein ABW21_db0209731 [Orbilia brochopaga]|nr:hypothetical protein ABW21_db0209731 [Drechslerella brochopaga]